MKKITLFFPLHPVNFYGKNFDKQKRLELITSVSLSCKTCLQKFLFWSYPLQKSKSLNCGKKKGKRQNNE